MIPRPFWTERIERSWRKAPIVWLSGVRRAGKTTLAQTLGNAEFLNCDLPSSQHLLDDPEAFYRIPASIPSGWIPTTRGMCRSSSAWKNAAAFSNSSKACSA